MNHLLDPACGTAGFLISAYKYILKTNSKNGITGAALSPDERKTLTRNIKGYDISPDMVRLSLVNLYLHGFTDPHINEYDTLTSEDNWNEYADIILANPPFMSPKGGIKPHKRFSIQAKRSEVLFVDYFIEHLSIIGKAGIIVPEGVMFVNQAAFKKVRKKLVEESLIAVITLPHGVFKPYASVKTHILILDKSLSKKSDCILFVNIESDGFSQSDTRLPVDKNDLPEALKIIRPFKNKIRNNKRFVLDDVLTKNNCIVTKDEILKDTSIHLIGRWYSLRNTEPFAPKYQYEKIGKVCNILDGQSPNMKTKPGMFTLVVPAEHRKPSDHFTFNMKAVCIPLVSSSGHGKADIKRLHYQEGKFALADTMCCLQSKDEEVLSSKYLYELLEFRKNELLVPLMAGTTNVTMKPPSLKNIKIPIPPISIQNKIVRGKTLQRAALEAKKLHDILINEIDGDFGEKKSSKLSELLCEIKKEKEKSLAIKHVFQ